MALEKWQWAWLAGIFEGEGNIGYTNRASVQLRIVMTDEDVVRTVHRYFPAPSVRTYEFSHKKTQWIWQISGRDEAREFLEGIAPFLHERRGTKAAEALTRLAGNWGAAQNRTHCKRGHPLSGENLYISRTTGGRSCLTCRREHDRTRVR